MSKKNNLSWKISLLEAQTENNSNISRATLAAEKTKRRKLKQVRREYKAQLALNSNINKVATKNNNFGKPSSLPQDSQSVEKLAHLRHLKAQQKIHHIHKSLSSTVKKNKGMQIQKIVKTLNKLKSKLEDGVTDSNKVHLDRQIDAETALIAEIKTVDINHLSELLLIEHLINNTNLSEFQKELDLVNRINSFEKIVQTGEQIPNSNIKKLNLKQKVFKLFKSSNPIIDHLKEIDVVSHIITGDNKAILKNKLEKKKSKNIQNHNAPNNTILAQTQLQSSVDPISNSADILPDQSNAKSILQSTSQIKDSADFVSESEYDDLDVSPLGSDIELDSDREIENELKMLQGSQSPFNSESELDSDTEIGNEIKPLQGSELTLNYDSEFDSELYSDYEQDGFAQKASKKTKTSSNFISSLNGNDFSESDDDGFTNRPGQRQRRAQFEKLYGKEANHIQLLPKALRDNKGSSDHNLRNRKEFKPSKSFTSNYKKPSDFNSFNQDYTNSQTQDHSSRDKPFNTRFSDNTNNNTKPFAVHTKTPTPIENVHPSWAAKQAERQKIAMLTSGQIKGKKIVFD
ncbi:hypothetical protein BB561_001229 [Smittium simulii]|uniref:Bud22 domain-containing protein n=1 Tax=Smittium simulii TaxID=133385 RepID=A0A2T9YVK1_9FUNG|nr:hypothetical protein BB561_001229 [Smittium simulii]